MRKFILLIFLGLVSFVNANAQNNPGANPTVNITWSETDAMLDVGQTSVLTMELKNTGSDPIGVDGATVNVSVSPNMTVDQSSFVNPDPSTFSVTFFVDTDGTTYIQIKVIAEIPGTSFDSGGVPTYQFNVTATANDSNIGTLMNSTINVVHNPQINGNLNAGDDNASTKMTVNQPTPVELVSFDAEARGNVSVLTWETSSELNNEGFFVERSKDGKRFESLGFVKGNGTASVSNTYEFIDETPNEDNYYRLRQVDFDGSEDYSDIEFVRFNTNVSASVYPNPFVDRLTISTGAYAGPIAVSIIDANGRLISNEVTSDRNKDLSDLKAGVYFLYVRNEEGVELLKEKVIKVK